MTNNKQQTKDSSLEEIMISTFKDSFFFTKYPELSNGKDVGNGSMPFVEGGYSDQTIVAETMRFFPLACALGAKFFMPQQAPWEQAVEWVNNGIGGCNVYFYDNDSPQNYQTILSGPSRANPHNPTITPNSLHVLHPYATLPSHLYIVDPETLLWLNTKTNLSKLTKNTPKKSLMNLDNVLKLDLPYVLKKQTGSSGDGVKIIKDPKDLESLSSFIGKESVIVEDYIDYKENYGVNYIIDKSGKPHFVGHCKQHTTPSGEFCGAICLLDSTPPQGLLDVTEKACLNVAKKGYYGFLGFDVLQDKKDDFYIIDPNIRCTAATPVYVLKSIIAPKLGPNVYCGSSEMSAKNPGEVINKINSAGGMLLSMSHEVNGIYKFFGMFGGKTCEKAFTKWTNFNKK